jgi:uncharacterized low-complexity protein
MSKQNQLKPLAAALGTAFVTSLAGANVANAAENPFSMTELSSGYMVADSHEGKCGEGKCGGEKKMEGKCGEGKCGEGMKKMEGKCGGEKKMEGKCGGEKSMEGKCGGKMESAE